MKKVISITAQRGAINVIVHVWNVKILLKIALNVPKIILKMLKINVRDVLWLTFRTVVLVMHQLVFLVNYLT